MTRKPLCGLLPGLLACVPATAADDPPVYRIAIPGIPPDSGLVGIKLTIRSGRVYRLVDCPAGWSVNILDDPNWTATVDAHAVVGAAAITSREASTMMLVAAAPRAAASSDALPVSATGELTTMRYGDGETGTVKLTRITLVRDVPPRR